VLRRRPCHPGPGDGARRGQAAADAAAAPRSGGARRPFGVDGAGHACSLPVPRPADRRACW
jgi:hypothetical protein